MGDFAKVPKMEYCDQCGGYHATVQPGEECGYVKMRRETGNPNWPKPAPDGPTDPQAEDET